MNQRRPAERFRGYPGQPGVMRQSHGPGWALVGDAGYFKDPITAHGISDALRDAELLARAVIRGSDRAWPHGRRWPGPARVGVRIGAPLHPAPVSERAAVETTLARIGEALRELEGGDG